MYARLPVKKTSRVCGDRVCSLLRPARWPRRELRRAVRRSVSGRVAARARYARLKITAEHSHNRLCPARSTGNARVIATGLEMVMRRTMPNIVRGWASHPGHSAQDLGQCDVLAPGDHGS